LIPPTRGKAGSRGYIIGAEYTGSVRFVPRVAIMISVALAMLLTGSCRDLSSDQERADGMTLRSYLRQNECRITTLNAEEFAYAESVKLFLKAAETATKADSVLWPTTARVDEEIGELPGFEAQRRVVIRILDHVELKTPLPIAIREDVRDTLNERIANDEVWSVRLRDLREAIVLGDEVLVHDEVKRCEEAFAAYGVLQNAVKVAADDIEEQLRLPWWNDERPCGQNESPPSQEPK
jgi:hypothetical protein